MFDTVVRPVAHTPSASNPGQWHDLKAHLSKVGAEAERLADKFGAGRLGYYAGLWHDLGKYNPKFQHYLRDCHAAALTGAGEPKSRVPHAIYGAKLAAEVLQPLAPIIYGHHGGLPQQARMESRLAELDEADYRKVLECSQDEIALTPQPGFAAGIAELAPDVYSFEFLLRMLFSCLVDADYLDTEQHFSPEIAPQRGSAIALSDLWSKLQADQAKLMENAADTTVNLVRSQVYQACLEAATQPSGVFRLAVPTGGGKTRSGLAFGLAHAAAQIEEKGHDRVIIAVPYTSIIEQTVAVYRAIFGEAAVLEHHSAIRPEDGNEEDARSRQAQARLATQNWDAPLIVTTTVQLLESLFANRTSRCRKLHNIANSIIILDEVQTLPVGLLEPILDVLKLLCDRYGVSLVLCTATQPALEGQSPYLKGFDLGSVRDIIPKEMAQQHFNQLSRVTYEIPQQSWSWAEVAGDACAQEGQQALLILNTRKDALAVLEAMLNQLLEQPSGSASAFHLSTLLCGAHRRQVLAEVRQRLEAKQPCYLVSTQVVEAGVDLDFPAVYRAVGPLDRIVQAAGRCNREGKLEQQGRVVIFEPEEGKLPPGEYRTAVDETLRLLRQPDLDLNDPSIFEQYFRRLYQGLTTDKHNIQDWRESRDYPEVAKRFKLIPDDTTAVVVQFDDEVRDRIRQIQRRGLRSSDYRALQPYLVNLRDREFRQAEEVREEIAPGVWVWHGGYDPLRGIGLGERAIAYDPVDLCW